MLLLVFVRGVVADIHFDAGGTVARMAVRSVESRGAALRGKGDECGGAEYQNLFHGRMF
jgi:hypothetical protein